jgi:hypothetical protein
MYFILQGRAMAQTFSRPPLTTEAWVRSRDFFGGGICCGQCGTEICSLGVLRCFFASIFPPVLHIHITLHVALTRRTKLRSLGTLKIYALSETGEH